MEDDRDLIYEFLLYIWDQIEANIYIFDHWKTAESSVGDSLMILVMDLKIAGKVVENVSQFGKPNVLFNSSYWDLTGSPSFSNILDMMVIMV